MSPLALCIMAVVLNLTILATMDLLCPGWVGLLQNRLGISRCSSLSSGITWLLQMDFDKEDPQSIEKKLESELSPYFGAEEIQGRGVRRLDQSVSIFDSKEVQEAKRLGFAPIIEALKSAANLYARSENVEKNEKHANIVHRVIARHIYRAFKEVDQACHFFIEDAFKRSNLPSEYKKQCEKQILIEMKSTNENLEERIKKLSNGQLVSPSTVDINYELNQMGDNWCTRHEIQNCKYTSPTPANSDCEMILLYKSWAYIICFGKFQSNGSDGPSLAKILREEPFRRMGDMRILAEALKTLHVNSHEAIKTLVNRLYDDAFTSLDEDDVTVKVILKRIHGDRFDNYRVYTIKPGGRGCCSCRYFDL